MLYPSFMASSFLPMKKALYLQRICPPFNELSFWCKAIVTILSLRSLEQADEKLSGMLLLCC